MRNKRAREKKKVLKSGNNVTSKLPDVTHELPECYTEKDKELEKDIEIEQELKKDLDKHTDIEKDRYIEKDRDKEIKTEQRSSENKQSCSSCDNHMDKSKNVIGKHDIDYLNHREEIAIDIEENPVNGDGEYRNRTKENAHIYNNSDMVNENIDIIKHFEKCGFTVSEKLKEFIEEDIKKYGRKLIIEAADECVRKGKSNNYGYLTGILQNWIIKGKENKGADNFRANASAYTPMKSIFDEE